MTWLLSVFFFIFGLTVGSFLNSVIYRLQTKESFLKIRSFCPHCKHELSWQDLIPIFSFLILKGKCRYCHQKISLQYPLVEIATGLLFVLIFNFQNWSGYYPDQFLGFQNLFSTCYLLLATSFLIIIFVYDLKHYIIPDKVIYPAIVIAFLYNIFLFHQTLYTKFYILNPVFAALGAAALFSLIFLISRGKWLGFGDVKLVFFMGLFLSFPNILIALFLAFLIGAIIGLGLIILGRKELSSKIPFGPFLVTGTFLALFFGENLINWYFNLFL